MSAAAKAMEANLWDRVLFLAKGRKEAVIQDSPDLLLVDSGLLSSGFNRIGRCSLHPRYGVPRIEAAINHFRERNTPIPFSWTIGPVSGHGALEPTLTELGLAPVAQKWGMVAAWNELRLPNNAADSLDIKSVSNKQGVIDFAGLVATLSKPPSPDLLNLYTDANLAIVMPNSPMKLYVCYAGGKPVATAEAYYAHGVVGFWNILADTTVAGKGYAPAMLMAALRDAKRSGQTTAFLQAETASKPIYERLGFKAIGMFTDYQYAKK